MSARGQVLIRAAAASLLLHGLAAAAAVVWDRSRGAEANAPEAVSVAVDVMWLAEPSMSAAPPPPDPTQTVRPISAAQATIVATRAQASAPPLTPLAGAADVVRAAARTGRIAPGAATADVVAVSVAESLAPAISEVSLLPASPASAPLVSTDTQLAAVTATAPGAATGAISASVAERGAVLTAATDSVASLVASAPGPMWAPAGRRNVRPKYPPLARRRGLEGRTLLKVEILASGKSGAVAVISSSGHALLDNAALAAVRQWTFVPAGDVARETTTFIEVPVSFRLID